MIALSDPEFATTTRDICRIFFRHKGKIISCLAVTVCVALAVVMFWPRKYKSEAKLFVKVGRETVTLDPTATTGQVIPISLLRETEINSVLEMLRSRAMIEKLVDAIGPAAILRPTSTEAQMGEQPPTALSSLLSIVTLDPVSDREKAVTRVAKRLEATVEKKSDVVTISGTAESPELAQRMVGRLVDIYIGEHVRMHRTVGSQAFFTEQTLLLQKNLTAALAKLRDAKNELGILTVEHQREILRDATVAVETKLAQSTAALAASHEKIESLRRNVDGMPERQATDEIQGVPNSAADTMRNELYQLEIREAELASKFTDKFPALVAVRAQIQAVRKPLTNEEHRRTQTTTGRNLTHEHLQVDLLSEESTCASLQAETKSLGKQLVQLRDRARDLNDHELEIANLDQQVSLCKANYATYSEKSEQSRIDAALQSERITNVNVIQPANLVAKPLSPRKATVLVLGVLVGLALGFGVALLAEYIDFTLKTPADVEQRLSMPVLHSIPRVTQNTVLN